MSGFLARSPGEAFSASGSAFAAYLPDDEWLPASAFGRSGADPAPETIPGWPALRMQVRLDGIFPASVG